MLALAGAFSGITTSVHATHADDVQTEADLKSFVEAAVDEYYIEFLLKTQCDLTTLDFGQVGSLIGPSLAPLGISDLSPSSMQMLTTEQVKNLIALFPTVQSLLPPDFDMWDACTLPQPDSTFRDVFEASTDWKSGSIYLFVGKYPQGEQRIIYNGQDPRITGQEDLTGLEDESGNMIMDLIEQAADGTVQGRTEAGFFDYCWDDPATMDDDLPDDSNILTAPGDSWKTGYVVDPFAYLGVPAPSSSPRIILGSGIYPTGNPPSVASECDGNGMVGDGGDMDGMEDMDDMEDMEPEMEPEMEAEEIEEVVEDVVESVSGGGCAIAAGSDSTPGSNALNLLLIVSALFFTATFGNRATGRRNGIRS